MQAIYRPKGRALEYGDLACNLYRGCEHACDYCFGPGALRMQREDFYQPRPRPGILEALDRDAAKIVRTEGVRGPVFLCFSCDPYQPIEEEHELTRQAIEILHSHGIGVRILTKAGRLPMRDLDLLGDTDEIGVTLTTLNEDIAARWEPGADEPTARTALLAMAHHWKIRTWVSLEPVIDPSESLQVIRDLHKVVDIFKIGKWNHDARAKLIDWPKFRRDAVELCDALGKSYYIKLDLVEA